jgi:hypothetical protein
MRTRQGLRPWQLVSGLLLLSTIGGCRPPATEIVLGLATDLRVPDELDRVELRVTRGCVEIVSKSWRLRGVDGQGIDLPISYALYTDGDTPTVDITLMGFRNQQERVRRNATVSFVREKTLFLRLALVGLCAGQLECRAGQTCIEGRCDAQVTSELLPEFDQAERSRSHRASDPARARQGARRSFPDGGRVLHRTHRQAAATPTCDRATGDAIACDRITARRSDGRYR